MNLAMDILVTLVSETGGMLAHSNREDLVRYHGVVLMSSFIACPTGQFATHAIKVSKKTSFFSSHSKFLSRSLCLTHCCISIPSYFRYLQM